MTTTPVYLDTSHVPSGARKVVTDKPDLLRD
jgi:hypothetical protein